MSNNQQIALSPAVLKTEIAKRGKDFAAALPTHIPSEKFERTLVTAISNSPELLKAMQENPRSVFNAAAKAAQDGLIPDGREAALVVFNSKDKQTNSWKASAVYMPMVYGLMKKVRQSGGVSALFEPQVVYENDRFVYELGFEPKLSHTPLMRGDRGEPLGAYAVAILDDKHNTKVSVFLTYEEIEKIRNVSKAKNNGPWKDWWEEMAKKSAMRRLCKYLPSSTDLDAAFTRDESYNPAEHIGDLKPIEAIAEPRPSKEPEQIEEQPEPFGPVIDHVGEVSEDHLTHNVWANCFLLLIEDLEKSGNSKDIDQVFDNNKILLKALHGIDPDKAAVLLEMKPKHSDFPGDDNYKPE